MRAISVLETEQYVVECPPEFGGPVVWRRLTADGIELSNCIELADWDTEPAFPFVCADCFSTSCAACGLARIRRTATQLVWLPPTSISRSWPPQKELEQRGIQDAYLIDQADWDRQSARHSQLPPVESFPPMTEGDLYRLWLQQRPRCAVEQYEDSFVRHLRRNCIASHPLEIAEAIAAIAEFERRLSMSDVQFVGHLDHVEPDPDSVQTFYFDGRDTPAFTAFTAERPHRFVIGGAYVVG